MDFSAVRISKYMRAAFGFYPSAGKKNEAQWDIYKTTAANVKNFLVKNRITGVGARNSFSLIQEFVKSEGDDLWEAVKTKHLDYLPSREACEPYLYSIVFATMGSYDAYRSANAETQ